MNFSVKAINFSSQTNVNSSNKNEACQPLRGDVGIYKVNFGNGESQVVNDHGDSITISSKVPAKSESELPLSFGQRFINAAKKVSEKLTNKNDTGKVSKELGKELYGIEVN